MSRASRNAGYVEHLLWLAALLGRAGAVGDVKLHACTTRSMAAAVATWIWVNFGEDALPLREDQVGRDA